MYSVCVCVCVMNILCVYCFVPEFGFAQDELIATTIEVRSDTGIGLHNITGPLSTYGILR